MSKNKSRKNGKKLSKLPFKEALKSDFIKAATAPVPAQEVPEIRKSTPRY
jgi:hypothetical protein